MSQSADLPALLVPEMFTHLYQTPWYAQLDPAQRLTYNRLYGLRINEQFIQFEEVFIKGLMPRLKRHKSLRDNPRLLNSVELILSDEERHSRMFAQYNQAIRPDLYRHTPNPFTPLSTIERILLNGLLAAPGLVSCLLWLMLAMEELTTAISQALIDHPRSDQMDQTFLTLHRQHLHDEKRHVGIDRKLILNMPAEASSLGQQINARLFRYVFSNVLKPRRSTIQVIRQLVRDCPELAPLKKDMIDAVRTLDPQTAFPANLLGADKLPVLHSLFDHFPDYRVKDLGLTATD